MNLRNVLVVNALLGSVHGLAFVLLPTFALGFYGVSTGPGERLMGQFFGTELLAVALVCWLARGLTDGAVLRIIAVAMCIPNGVGTLIAVMATAGGVMNSFGWLGAAIYGALAGSYAWFLFATQSGSKALAES